MRTFDPNSPVKVVHLIKSLNRGGAETLLSEGLRVADREHFCYEYGYFIDRYDGLAALLREQGAHVESFGASGEREMLLSVPRVARYIRETRADVVHAHLPLAGVVARLAGRLAGVPVVYTEHNPTRTYRPATRALSWMTWGLGTRAIAISPDVEAAMRYHAGSRVPIDLVLNGIDTDRFSAAALQGTSAKAALGIPAGAPVVGTVGMFRLQKRYDVWIAAARRILNVLPEAHFIITGDGAELGATRQLAERLGLTDRVSFAGGQDDVRPYLAAMDLFMMSSEYEGFGLAPVEAMSMEVPVVATDVDGIRTVVQNGINCTLVPFDEHVSENLGAAAVALLRDPARQASYRAAGRRVAVDRFELRQMQRNLEEIYVRVLEARGRAGTSTV